jgi:hypothetical protein
MDVKQLRQRCEARLRAVDLPEPFDVDQFTQRLARQRGRPIKLLPHEFRAAPCGAWIPRATEDCIYFARDTGPLHREHIILHELCHLLCGHQPTSVIDPALLGALFTHLHPSLVERYLQRQTYVSEDDQEAELLATLILERAARERGRETLSPSHETTELLDRLQASLERPGEG